MKHYFVFIASGLYLSLVLAIASMLVGLVGGVIFAICRNYRWVKLPIDSVLSVLRGTPMILQLNFFFFAVPGLFGAPVSVLIAGICTLGINSSAYIAEILRGGINSVPKGQFEAAKTLRIPAWLMWRDIILPQVFRHELPALVTELTTLLKDTSLISTLGGMDLMRHAHVLAADNFDYFGPLCVAGVYYYVLVMLITTFGQWLEKRCNYAVCR